jgi:hypothetical protein
VRFATALLLLLFAAGAARGQADTLEKGAQADATLEERLKAKARTIPGTGIQYLIAGYAQLDAHWTRRELAGDEKDAFLASAIPFDAADRHARVHIRASQINAILKSGEITALAQADLFAYEEGTKLNVTQFAARYRDWLAIGKTYSTFMDDEAWPATLDYNGPSGAVFVRQFVVRGGLSLGERLRVEAALEDAQASESAAGAGFSVSASAERPDLVARLRYGSERVHAQLAGLSRSVTYSAQLASVNTERRVSGYGLSLSAAIQVLEEDRLLLQWNEGEGIGRYFNDGLSGVGAVFDAGGRLEPLKLSGVYAYYERKWAERWTTTAGASVLRTRSEGLRPASDLRRAEYASANLVHRLATDLFLGAELLWGRAERVDGSRADDTRVQLTARYYLY